MLLSSLKLKKKQKDKLGDLKELSSIVKEPSFLKGDKSPKIGGGNQDVKEAKNQQDESFAELVKKKKHDKLKVLKKLAENKIKNLFFRSKEFLRLNKKKIAEGVQEDLKKKINKSVNSIIKDLDSSNKQLNSIRRRLEKKEIKEFEDSLKTGADYIKKGLVEIESGLNEFLCTQDEGKEERNVNDESIFYGKNAVFDVKADLIRMNIKKETMVNALRGCFLKKKIVILLRKDISFLEENLLDFFDSILKDSFDIKVVAISQEEYKKSIENYRDYLVLSNGEVIGKYKYGFNDMKTDIENHLIKEFYEDPYLNKGLKRLKHRLQEIYNLSEELCKYYKMKNNISRKEVVKYLEAVYFPKNKIKKDHLSFLERVAREYFNTEIKFKQDTMGELINNMWGK
ncbi:MAG: hypothetical protein ACTSPS_11550 [Promethearchaeota archaeon]